MSIMESLRKRFQISSLASEAKERLGKYIKHLGGTYLNKQIFAKHVSHVICGKPSRGEKYLAGCVSGRWILKKEFIEDSYKQGRWLSEEDYEWQEDDIDEDSPLLPLYSAPRKWRKALNNKDGGFKNWHVLVHVKDVKMKRAYERLLEAGCATISKMKAPCKDIKLTEGITHVFVEPGLRRDVLCLEKNGIPCVSPDCIPEYIIQIANDQEDGCLKDSELSNVMNVIRIPSKSVVMKQKGRGVLPGKENERIGKGNEPTDVNRKGVKRKIIDNCDLCQAKRQKKMMMSLPHCLTFLKRNNHGPVKNEMPCYPVYISSTVESCVEEGCILLALESLSSSLSAKYAPSSECLHLIMDTFLLGSPSKHQAMQSYQLLQKILSLHPSSLCQNLYLNALIVQPEKDSQTENDPVSAWTFVSKVMSSSLKVHINEDNNLHKTNRKTSRVQANAEIMLQFLDNLFKGDANCRSGQQAPLILQVLCPNGAMVDSSKVAITEFVKLCYQSVKVAVNYSTKLNLCQVMLDLLSLAVSSLKSFNEKMGKECCQYIAQQLFVAMSRNPCSQATKLLLQGCQSSWLKMKITELLLDNLDKRLVPQKQRSYIDKTLTLMKIVSLYFFLLPRNTLSQGNASLRKHADTKDAKKQSDSKNYKINKKGETALHVACIHNDVAKVDEILKQPDVDVNTTDNAGWTALHEACNHGHVQCVEEILNYHEATNKVDLLLAPPSCGTTALHDAVVNNHLAVVKLLLRSGGQKLLQAKTMMGKTAIDLSKTQDMIRFLKSEFNSFAEVEENVKQGSSLHIETDQITQEKYEKILKRDGEKTFVSMEDCQYYLFVVSQLVQCYVKEAMLAQRKMDGLLDKACKNCKGDSECYGNITGYINCFERHAKLITGTEELSEICKVYLASMKECL